MSSNLTLLKIGNSVGFITLSSGILITGTGLNTQNSSDEPFAIGISLAIGALYASTQPINILDKGYSINKEWKFSIQIHSSEKPLSLK